MIFNTSYKICLQNVETDVSEIFAVLKIYTLFGEIQIQGKR